MTMAAVHETLRFTAPQAAQGTVLLIEDDAPLARSLIRVMNAEGYQVVHVGSGGAAVDKLMHRSFDAVISDLNLPGASGVDVLNVVRAYDPDVPLVLMTGLPTVDTAIEAVSLGVLEYLVKPTPREQLVRVLARATKVRRAAMQRREVDGSSTASPSTAETVRPPPPPGTVSGVMTIPAPAMRLATAHDPMELVEASAAAMANAARAATVSAMPASRSAAADGGATSRTCPSIRATFERAMETLTVDLEPVADANSKKLLGFAARMSSAEEALTSESALVVTAERLGKLEELRRRVRDLAVKAFVAAPADALLFVDVHPSDLLDGELYSPEPPLARIAERVVLQVRARGLTMEDLSARASVLRFVGFRLAIADLDAGQACLSQIAELSPEFVKIDARMVRGLDGSLGRRRLVTALVSMCRALEAEPIAEGVSTAEEREALVAAGCHIVQGPIAMRHLPPSSRRPSFRTEA